MCFNLRFGPKVREIVTKWDMSGTFQYSFSVHFGSAIHFEPNMTSQLLLQQADTNNWMRRQWERWPDTNVAVILCNRRPSVLGSWIIIVYPVLGITLLKVAGVMLPLLYSLLYSRRSGSKEKFLIEKNRKKFIVIGHLGTPTLHCLALFLYAIKKAYMTLYLHNYYLYNFNLYKLG